LVATTAPVPDVDRLWSLPTTSMMWEYCPAAFTATRNEIEQNKIKHLRVIVLFLLAKVCVQFG